MWLVSKMGSTSHIHVKSHMFSYIQPMHIACCRAGRKLGSLTWRLSLKMQGQSKAVWHQKHSVAGANGKLSSPEVYVWGSPTCRCLICFRLILPGPCPQSGHVKERSEKKQWRNRFLTKSQGKLSEVESWIALIEEGATTTSNGEKKQVRRYIVLRAFS